jgi:hypothetical protein
MPTDRQESNSIHKPEHSAGENSFSNSASSAYEPGMKAADNKTGSAFDQSKLEKGTTLPNAIIHLDQIEFPATPGVGSGPAGDKQGVGSGPAGDKQGVGSGPAGDKQGIGSGPVGDKKFPLGKGPYEKYDKHEDGGGSLTLYDEDGTRRSVENYDPNKKPISKTTFDEKGKPKESSNYDENGNLEEFSRFKNGKLDETTHYNKDGSSEQRSKDEGGYRTEKFDQHGTRRSLELTDEEGKPQESATFDEHGKFQQGKRYLANGETVPLVQKPKD